MTIDRKEMDKSELLGNGKMANVFKIGNKALKIYKSLPVPSRKTLEDLTKISNERFIFPDEILYENEAAVGYTMPLLDGKPMMEVVDDIQFDELYADMEGLEIAIEELSSNGVIMNDSHEGNYFYDIENKQIKIIDTDFYVVTEKNAEKSNLRKNNGTLQRVLGIGNGDLSTYVKNSAEIQIYIEQYQEKYREMPSTCALMRKMQQVSQNEFGQEFETLGQLKGRVSQKEREFEEKIEEYSEGDDALYQALLSARKNGVESQYCCAGHKILDWPYISFKYDEKSVMRLDSVLRDVSTMKDITVRISNNGTERTPSFTVYTKNNSKKREVFLAIASSLGATVDREQDNFPENLSALLDIRESFEQRNVNYSMCYEFEKNKFDISMIKDELGRRPKGKEMKKSGYKIEEDVYRNIHYSKKVGKGKKEVADIIEIKEQLEEVPMVHEKRETIFDKLGRIFKPKKALPEPQTSKTKEKRKDTSFVKGLKIYKEESKTQQMNECDELSDQVQKVDEKENEER